MGEQCAHEIPEHQENKVLGDTGYACARDPLRRQRGCDPTRPGMRPWTASLALRSWTGSPGSRLQLGQWHLAETFIGSNGGGWLCPAHQAHLAEAAWELGTLESTESMRKRERDERHHSLELLQRAEVSWSWTLVETLHAFTAMFASLFPEKLRVSFLQKKNLD